MNSISPEIIAQLKSILASDQIFLDTEIRQQYGHDHTEDLKFPPAVVLKPETTQEVASILKLANEHLIPVTPIGARTGLSGGALSIFGGIGLSMERFNRIIEIDKNNFQATVEPGVITQIFQEAVKEHGLMYPPDPASKGSCFIGGNVAENSGGPKAVKYGVTKDYVINLELVTPQGEIIWTGANTLKNSTGYNLTQLIVGSEGTLGVVTKIVMKLLPYPKHDLLMLIPFKSAEKACEAVSAIFHAGIMPSGLEFMERDAIVYAAKFIGEEPLHLSNLDQAHLIVEVDGNEIDSLMQQCENIMHVAEKYECGEVLFAEDENQKSEFGSSGDLLAKPLKPNLFTRKKIR